MPEGGTQSHLFILDPTYTDTAGIFPITTQLWSLKHSSAMPVQSQWASCQSMWQGAYGGVYVEVCRTSRDVEQLLYAYGQ